MPIPVLQVLEFVNFFLVSLIDVLLGDYFMRPHSTITALYELKIELFDHTLISKILKVLKYINFIPDWLQGLIPIKKWGLDISSDPSPDYLIRLPNQEGNYII